MNNSLVDAMNVNREQAARVDRDFDKELSNWINGDMFKRWMPKVSRVKENTRKISLFLTEFRNQLQVEAGSTNNYPVDSLDNKKLSKFSKIFFNRRGELKAKLQDYMTQVFDTIGVEGFFGRSGLSRLKESPVLQAWGKQDEELDARKIPIIGAIALVNGYEAKVRRIEYEIMKFAYWSAVGIVEDFTKFSVILTMNSTVVRGGERIEVYVGVGDFSVASKPNFFIDGKALNPDVEGVVTYSIKAPMKKGKHSIPVKVKYVDSNGEVKYITKTLSYEVVDCGASGH